MTDFESPLFVTRDLAQLSPDAPEGFVAHVVCTAGRLDFAFAEQPFSLRAGETMIVGDFRAYEETDRSDDLAVRCVYARFDFLERSTPRSNYGVRGAMALHVNPVMRPDARRFARLCADFDRIEECLAAPGLNFRDDMLLCATQMMILDYFDIHTAENGAAHIASRDGDLVSRFMALLEKGAYVEHRDLEFYADKLFVTPKYLSEVCKAVSGRAANYWITRFATMHIRRLLQERELSFTEISERFGFSSPSYFSRFVRKNLGAAPSDFRA